MYGVRSAEIHGVASADMHDVASDVAQFWSPAPGSDGGRSDDVLEPALAASRHHEAVAFEMGSVRLRDDRAELQLILMTGWTIGTPQRRTFETSWIHKGRRWFRMPSDKTADKLENVPPRPVERCAAAESSRPRGRVIQF